MRLTVPIVNLIIIASAIAFMALLPAMADDVPVTFFKKPYADYDAKDRQSYAMKAYAPSGQAEIQTAQTRISICH